MRLGQQFRYAVYFVFWLLFLTGVGWFGADRLKDSPDGEMWQMVCANLLMIHGGAAMIALMFLGALFPMHVQRAWRANYNKATGSVMVTLAAGLIGTAFALYYLGGEAWRPTISTVHLIVGCVAPVLLFVHIIWGRRSLRSRRPAERRGYDARAEAPVRVEA